MKALFLDIDGVIQSHNDQNRFKHIEEFVDLSKRAVDPAEEEFRRRMQRKKKKRRGPKL